MTVDALPATEPEDKKGEANAVGWKKSPAAKSESLKTNAAVRPGGSNDADAQAKLRYFRATTHDDLVKLLDTALEYHTESRYAHIPFSQEKYLKTYSQIVVDNADKALSIYAELNGEVVGLMGAQIGDYFLGNGARIATNFILYVSPSARHSLLGGRIALRLMRMFMEWARANGADELNIHATSGIEPEQSDKFLRRLGFKPYGGNYAVRLG